MSISFWNLQQNEYLSESLKRLCLFNIKWRSFQLLEKFAKNEFYLADLFKLCKHHSQYKKRYLFLSMYVLSAKGNEEMANSGYTSISFTINGPLKILPCHVRYFHTSNFNPFRIGGRAKKLPFPPQKRLILNRVKMTFEKKIWKNCHFLTLSKFLICRKFLRSGSRWQENDSPLHNYWNLQKELFVCLVYLNWRHMRYLIFAVPRICTIDYFTVRNLRYISLKNGPLEVLLCHFRYFNFSQIFIGRILIH